jgi:molybdopterin-containing oxidoreductase family iron-sulfur binding subunit
LKLFGASVALMQASCMERTGEEIRPSVRVPEHAPGTPRTYATSMVIDGFATGLLALSYDGRPTKIDGNPVHPASLGATLAVHQASILDLYDPHRLRAPRLDGMPATWERFRRVLEAGVDGQVWLVLPPEGSPSIAAQLAVVRDRFPSSRVVWHSALSRNEAYRGTQLAFGAPLEQQIAFERADVLVALDSDVLAAMPMSLRWSRGFAQRRRAVEAGEQPIRVFAAEPMLTPTGTMADHRLAVRAGDVVAVAIALAEALESLGVASVALPTSLRRHARARIADHPWIELAARALARSPRTAVLAVGDRQPAAVHALAHRIALALGCVGTTTSYTRPALAAPLGEATLDDLAAAIRAKQVGAVFAIDTDPVHDAPCELDLAMLLRQVPLAVHAASYAGATSVAAQWLLPVSHYLEHWGDARAWDGTLSTIQPLIQPLHDSLSRLQLLALLAGNQFPDDRALVRARFDSEVAWRNALAEGLVAGTAAPALTVTPRGDGEIVGALAPLLATTQAIEVNLAPSPAILDGRFANNPWLQELPHPITKQTWGNAALLSQVTARKLALRDGQLITLKRKGATVDVPALIAPGHADGCITVELGYGQSGDASPIARGIGGNAAPLGGAGAIVRDVTAVPQPRYISLARTQGSFDRHHRETAFQLDLASYRAAPDQLSARRRAHPTLLDSPKLPRELLQWAMTIDTTICTGCSACVIACQAENNVPTVGADGVRRGREMHWLRIDTYVEDTPRGPAVVHQPMLCQHCEMAPCEYVCPVFATSHSPDGLNEMTYNRCVGTRFCSNNCPYKVRRFNFFAYDKPVTRVALQRNPNVTVRERGVMEKCTYCVQRIRAAEIRGRMEGRPIAPGEVVTACQQACPTQAIQFGALQHTHLPMAQWRESPRAYAALGELGTVPRTLYLAKIRNPEEGAE